MYVSCATIYVYSVKSSWELVFIVIQKPNSNKVFLSSYSSSRCSIRSSVILLLPLFVSFLCSVLGATVWLFVFFRLVILLHILLLFTAYSYYFGIFKQFMQLHHCNYFTDMWKLIIRCRLHLVINSLTRYCLHYFIRRLAERTKQKH